MSRYIDADKAVRLLQGRLMETGNNNCGFKCDAGSVYQDVGERIPRWIDEIPTADVRENVKGKLIEEPNCWYRCSNCGEHYPSIRGYMNYNYCPNCGAKMERSEE